MAYDQMMVPVVRYGKIAYLRPNLETSASRRTTRIVRLALSRTSTRLILTVPSKRPARLSVYDVAGRELATVWNGTLGPDPIEVVWRGVDRTDHALPSGTYLFRLTSRGTTLKTIRGLLVR